MKGSVGQNNEETKTPQTKTKKGAKSRAKSTKASTAETNASNSTNTSIQNAGSSITPNVAIGPSSSVSIVNAPTTPTSSLFTNSNSIFESPTGLNAGSSLAIDINIPVKNSQKNYAGLEERSIKIIWEQHDEGDMILAPEVAPRLAEDASYKMWEVCNYLKIFARNSGGSVTYDLVNEALSEYDCPPCLGAMDSDWERIDYDGSFFFHSDRVIELRDEYQKEETIPMPKGIEFNKFQPIEDKCMEEIKKYSSILMNVLINGDRIEVEQAMTEVAFSPLIGSINRVILSRVTQMLAFKQSDHFSARCWRILRACTFNPSTHFIVDREEIFHLAEVLICQLLAPFESLKDFKNNETPTMTNGTNIKMEVPDIKVDPNLDIKPGNDFLNQQQPQNEPPQTEEVYQANGKVKLELDNSESDMEVDETIEDQYSDFFACPVEAKYVESLCDTIGILASENAMFQNECIHHIIRRLNRFFEGREISTEKDYNYIGRCVRGLISLGEYGFREFIPFFYKLSIDDVPESLSRDFLFAAMYLHERDDIFLYECLAEICGADKLQPFMTHYAHYHDKFLKHRIKHAKKATFKFVSKIGVRRLDLNTLTATMSHGDDSLKPLRSKTSFNDYFPELHLPNPNINRPGTIRFKFAGCRPVVLKNKTTNFMTNPTKFPSSNPNIKLEPGLNPIENVRRNEVLIARRKLFKPLTNGYKMVRVSNYYTLKL